MNASRSNQSINSAAAPSSSFGAKPHKYFVFTRSAGSEGQLSLTPKVYKFYSSEEEARRQFEQEKPWAAGEHFEAGWGVLTLSHGMTDWRSVEPTDTRRGIA